MKPETVHDPMRRLVVKIKRLTALDPEALGAVETLVNIAIDSRTEPPATRTAGFSQQPPHNGRRSWRCTKCGEIFALSEGGE
jgi:hypothetical protein